RVNMKNTKILIVEDDETASYLMKSFLEDCDFLVDTVLTVTDGIAHLKNNNYNLLLLDLNLPDFSGFDLLSSIANSVAVPTIVTSAYNDTKTKVKAFKYGANDYITKPIDFLELEARIWALLSRKDNINLVPTEEDTIFKIDSNNIYFKDEVLQLTALEFDILSYFINNIGQVISREQLTNSITSVKSHRLLDNHIKNIRKKIEVASSKPVYLKTEYGLGYKLTLGVN
ncbi:MAG: response regulator transcription factor, partial [Sulfurimonas sp.]|nr:response regulator transcription factor [Sulfurimonas sp.]